MLGGMYQAIEHGKFALRLNKYIHFHGNFIKAIPGKIRLNLCRDIRVFFPFCRCPNAVQPNRFRHFGRHLRTVNSVQNGSDGSLSKCVRHTLLKAPIFRSQIETRPGGTAPPGVAVCFELASIGLQ